MRRFAAFMLLGLALACPARAEDAGPRLDRLPMEALQQSADDAGLDMDVRALARSLAETEAGAWEGRVTEALKKLAREAFLPTFPTLLTLMAPGLLWAVGRQMTGGGQLGAASETVCCLAGAGMLTGLLAEEMARSRAVTAGMAALTERFHPVMALALSASGEPGMAALMQPAGAMAAALMTEVMTRGVFALSGGMAAVCAAGSVSQRLRLEGLFRLMRTCANRLMGLSTTLFLGLVSAGSLLESGRDSLTMRAAGYAVDKMVPVIGGDVSDMLGTAVGSVRLLKSVVGVTGAAVAAGVCLGPMLRLTAAILSCRLAAALTEPAADGPMIRLLNGYADALRLLLLAQMACGVLFLIIAGAAAKGW